jgi:ketosteroid isomerase-like protein
VSATPTEGTPEGNLAQARRIAELNQRRGAEGVEEALDGLFHPDFEWRPAIVGLGQNVYRGLDGWRAWRADMDVIASESTVEMESIKAVGGSHVLALGRFRFVGRESGLPLDTEYAILCRMEEGRARSGQAFLSYAEGERAAAEAHRA